MVWLSNPITMPPMFYGCYVLGTWLLQTPEQEFNFELSWSWLTESLSRIGEPFLLGCLVAGIVCSSLGYFGMRIVWRFIMIKKWQDRKILQGKSLFK
jgi:uncharacterized protein (DUF2062 family)